MKGRKDSTRTTTVSVDAIARDRINEEAERLGVSQRQMVLRLIESYELEMNRKTKKNEMQVDKEMLQNIYDSLEKIQGHDDKVIALIKEQGRNLMNPTLLTVQAVEANLNHLGNLLSNLISCLQESSLS